MSTKSSNTSKNPTFESVLQERFGPRFTPNVSLRPLVCTCSGGVADYLVTVNSLDELTFAAQTAFHFRIAYRVIGGGTGVLVSDVGFAGLIIVNRCINIRFIENSQVIVDAGVSNNLIVTRAAERGFGGIEPLFKLPGSVGGALLTQAWVNDFKLIKYCREIGVLVADGNALAMKVVENRQVDWADLHTRAKKGNPSPVLLFAKLQLRLLPTDEIMRRIRLYRPTTVKTLARTGYCFYEGAEFSEKSKSNPFYRRSKFSLDKQDPNVINIHQQATSGEISQYLRALLAVNEQEGTELDLRIDTLGYWPDED